MEEIHIKKIRVPVIEQVNPFSDLWQKDLVLEKGKLYQIAAPSGQGKTTFLSILFGLRSDFRGDILFDKENTRGFSLNKWIVCRRNSLSLMFQDLSLFPKLTALENIQLKQQQSGSIASKLIMDFAKELSVNSILEKPVEHLSLGEAQRIAIIRCLAQPADFLLLDEPFSHLDSDLKTTAMALILEAAEKRKMALLLTSHDKESLGKDFQLIQV
ncbi:MAG: ATP-binding cassette domain-containing protein [Spirochaetales bacterium]|nr:ATP-binding cassette domain-containing protein [Spirochaetales bacterium]